MRIATARYEMHAEIWTPHLLELSLERVSPRTAWSIQWCSKDDND